MSIAYIAIVSVAAVFHLPAPRRDLRGRSGRRRDGQYGAGRSRFSVCEARCAAKARRRSVSSVPSPTGSASSRRSWSTRRLRRSCRRSSPSARSDLRPGGAPWQSSGQAGQGDRLRHAEGDERRRPGAPRHGRAPGVAPARSRPRARRARDGGRAGRRRPAAAREDAGAESIPDQATRPRGRSTRQPGFRPLEVLPEVCRGPAGVRPP